MRNYGTPVALYADRRAVFKYTPPAKIDAVPNEEAGIRELASQSKNLEPAIVLPEASRGVELSPVAALAAEEFTVVVANTRQMRDFAKATWRLAKTDALDAAVLAHSAEAVRPPVHPLRDPETRVLNSLASRTTK